jgi:hypothetical protein
MKALTSVLFTLAATALAIPTSGSNEQRGTPTVKQPVTPRQNRVPLCSQYAYHSVNGYEILNNLWGKDSATSGSQCTYYDGPAGNGIAWSSEWMWQGAKDNVKSYVYAGRQLTKGITVQRARNMPTSIQWNYNTTNNVRANVAYDIFTAQDPNHVNSSGDYELMVWYVHVFPFFCINICLPHICASPGEASKLELKTALIVPPETGSPASATSGPFPPRALPSHPSISPGTNSISTTGSMDK